MKITVNACGVGTPRCLVKFCVADPPRLFFICLEHVDCCISPYSYLPPFRPHLSFSSALLFGGLRESHEGRVDLPNTSADGFRILLHYVYSGRINLVELKEDQLLEQLGLANRYGFSDYENAIVHYLKAGKGSVTSLCTFFQIFDFLKISGAKVSFVAVFL